MASKSAIFWPIFAHFQTGFLSIFKNGQKSSDVLGSDMDLENLVQK